MLHGSLPENGSPQRSLIIQGFGPVNNDSDPYSSIRGVVQTLERLGDTRLATQVNEDLDLVLRPQDGPNHVPIAC